MPRKSKQVIKHELVAPVCVQYDCLMCFQRFTGEDLFREHQNQCQGHNNVGVGTSFSSIIKEEMKVLHNFPDSENETGGVAKKAIKQRKSTQHQSTQSSDSEYHSCKICDKKFKSKYSLKYHVDEHVTGGHTCHICYKSFAIAARLKQHMKTHEDDIYECDTCYKSFKCQYRLKYHQFIHTDQRKVCPIENCTKVFALTSQLNQHLESHDNSYNYICDVDNCGKKFKNKYRLKYHKMSHAQQSGCACMLCGKCFSEPALLKQHMIVHQEAGTHECTICYRKFKRKNTLKLHIQKHHKTLYNL